MNRPVIYSAGDRGQLPEPRADDNPVSPMAQANP